LRDLWVFDAEQGIFKTISSAGPEGRSFFGFAAVQAHSQWTLVVFGGYIHNSFEFPLNWHSMHMFAFDMTVTSC